MGKNLVFCFWRTVYITPKHHKTRSRWQPLGQARTHPQTDGQAENILPSVAEWQLEA